MSNFSFWWYANLVNVIYSAFVVIGYALQLIENVRKPDREGLGVFQKSWYVIWFIASFFGCGSSAVRFVGSQLATQIADATLNFSLFHFQVAFAVYHYLHLKLYFASTGTLGTAPPFLIPVVVFNLCAKGALLLYAIIKSHHDNTAASYVYYQFFSCGYFVCVNVIAVFCFYRLVGLLRANSDSSTDNEARVQKLKCNTLKIMMMSLILTLGFFFFGWNNFTAPAILWPTDPSQIQDFLHARLLRHILICWIGVVCISLALYASWLKIEWLQCPCRNRVATSDVPDEEEAAVMMKVKPHV